jgi:hypothetical protein
MFRGRAYLHTDFRSIRGPPPTPNHLVCGVNTGRGGQGSREQGAGDEAPVQYRHLSRLLEHVTAFTFCGLLESCYSAFAQ